MGVCKRPYIDSIVNVQEGIKSYNIIDTVNNREQPLHRDLRYKTKTGQNEHQQNTDRFPRPFTHRSVGVRMVNDADEVIKRTVIKNKPNVTERKEKTRKCV